MKRWLALAAFFLGAGGAFAQDVRTEIPITQKLGANGRYFYFITLSVGNSPPITALLDSGSTGLMLLPGTIGPQDAQESSRFSSYGYGSGAQFGAVIGHGVMKLGGLQTRGPISMRLVKSVACRETRPACPVAGHTLSDFGFAEEAGMGNVNRARIGVSLGASDADNPLAELGNGVWIIELPRPGDAAPGRVILNPGADDIAGYTRLAVNRETGQVPGCAVNGTGKLSVCGNVLPDTGGNGLTVEARQRPSSFPWADGTPAILALDDARGDKIGMDFTIRHVPGDPAALHWAQGNFPEPRISGSLPFLGFSILFDSHRHEIGFKPRL